MFLLLLLRCRRERLLAIRYNMYQRHRANQKRPVDECPATDAINETLQQKVTHAVNQLNCDERQLILLTDREGFSYEQISHILSIKVGTVRSRLNTARSHLLGLLKVK